MYQFRRTQLVKADLQTCWEFFISPANLSKITPSYMNFRVLTVQPPKAYEGLIIHYKVSPVLRIPLSWTTEITHIKEGKFFVDEQRKGPYRMWHHEHHFEETPEGVLMTDIVSYIMPFGFLGKIANALFVRRQLKEIFDYRNRIVEETFGVEVR
jgi:ligand-binding SRPBCC domain-containing protein